MIIIRMRKAVYLGLPLKNLSTNLLKNFIKKPKEKIQIIGVGGVDSGQSAFEKITAGANAVQFILEWFIKVQESKRN